MTTFLVLGAGGLGCPALLGLTSGGARRLVIVDDDHVEASNLQRQVLFTYADVGRPKVEAARHRLRARLPDLDVETHARTLDPHSLGILLASYGDRPLVVLECTDSPALKFAVNDACVRNARPAVIAGVAGWHGQAMAIAPTDPPSACYCCLFESPPSPEQAPTCAAVGVMGAAAGHLGYLAASLALSLADPGATPVAGRLIDVDSRGGAIRTLHPQPRRDCPVCSRTRKKKDNGNHQNPHPPAQVH